MLDWSTCVIGIPYLGDRRQLVAEGLYLRDGEIMKQWDEPRMIEREGSASGIIRLGLERRDCFHRKGGSFVDGRMWNEGERHEWAEGSGKYWATLGGPPDLLMFSGNPVKWLQGHNAVGASAAYHAALVRDVVLRANEIAELGIDWPLDLYPLFLRRRADITVSVRLEDQPAVLHWLAGAKAHVGSRHRQVSADHVQTVYWGKNSRHWTLKAYSKHAEISTKRERDKVVAACGWENYHLLRQWASGILRLELTLRRPELLKIDGGGGLSEELLFDYYGRLTVSGQRKNYDLLMSTMSASQRACYECWHSGADLREIYPRRTLYRHRAAIRRKVGVDINLPRPDESDDSDGGEYSAGYLRERVDDGKSVAHLCHSPEQPGFWE